MTDAKVNCDTGKQTVDGDCVITVKGTVTGRALNQNEKLYVLIKETGGNTWWVSGGGLTGPEVSGGTWENGWASIGKPDDPNTRYTIIALVSEEKMDSGDNRSELPPYAAASPAINITRGK